MLNIFWGAPPLLAPQSAASPKMTTPALPMTPLFYCRILFYSKNGDVCKKTRAQTLKIWRRYKGFKFEKKHFQTFSFVLPCEKNVVWKKIEVEKHVGSKQNLYKTKLGPIILLAQKKFVPNKERPTKILVTKKFLSQEIFVVSLLILSSVFRNPETNHTSNTFGN